MGTWIIAVAIAVLLALAVTKLVRDGKRGKCSGCAGCNVKCTMREQCFSEEESG